MQCKLLILLYFLFLFFVFLCWLCHLCFLVACYEFLGLLRTFVLVLDIKNFWTISARWLIFEVDHSSWKYKKNEWCFFNIYYFLQPQWQTTCSLRYVIVLNLKGQNVLFRNSFHNITVKDKSTSCGFESIMKYYGTRQMPIVSFLNLRNGLTA